MGEPRTTREALIAQMLGELDQLLTRTETLPKTVADAEAKLASTVTVLNEAGDKYRMAVTAFTQEAREELTEYLERKASEVAAKTVEEQRAALQEAARAAFRFEATERAAQLGNSLTQAAKEFRRSMGSRLLEHGITAVLASTLTAVMVLLLLKSS